MTVLMRNMTNQEGEKVILDLFFIQEKNMTKKSLIKRRYLTHNFTLALNQILFRTIL